MFISRVEMSWNEVRNPYEIHRRLWRLFPDEVRETRRDAAEARQGFLFRFEQYVTGRPLRVLLQSRKAPAVAEGAALLGVREFDPHPEAGQSLAFVLTANPIKTVADVFKDSKPDKRSTGVRVPLLKEEQQRDWLTRKLAGIADLDQVAIAPQAPIYFRKANRAGKIVPAVFEGTLRVADGDALRKLLLGGVGPAKAFGCGLLLVRRIS